MKIWDPAKLLIFTKKCFVKVGKFAWKILMSLQQMFMKLHVVTQFNKVNLSIEVFFCLYEKHEKMLILCDTS